MGERGRGREWCDNSVCPVHIWLSACHWTPTDSHSAGKKVHALRSTLQGKIFIFSMITRDEFTASYQSQSFCLLHILVSFLNVGLRNKQPSAPHEGFICKCINFKLNIGYFIVIVLKLIVLALNQCIEGEETPSCFLFFSLCMLAFLLGNVHLKSAVWLFLTIDHSTHNQHKVPLTVSKNSGMHSRTDWLGDTCMLSFLYKQRFCDILWVIKYGTHSWEKRTFHMTERARSWSRWRARFCLSVTVQGFAGQQQTRLPTPRCSRGTY